MAKTYFGSNGDGSKNEQIASPPASGPQTIRYYVLATGEAKYGYSGNVDGTKTFYVVNNGPTLGRQYSAT